MLLRGPAMPTDGALNGARDLHPTSLELLGQVDLPGAGQGRQAKVAFMVRLASFELAGFTDDLGNRRADAIVIHLVNPANFSGLVNQHQR